MPETKALKWDEAGDKLYRTGISNVALYVQDLTGAYQTGVAWNGVTSIEENPDGGDANDFYADNIKYLSLRAVEDFGATINAYDSPEEFDACDGCAEFAAGVKITQQSRRPFGLTYMTLIGNDTAGNDFAYEIHLVYSATASPSGKTYETVNDSPEPAELSWEIETTPIPVTGFKPTSHLVIDSRTADATKLTAFKKIIWGDTDTDPRLPLPDEVKTLLTATP